VVGFCGRCEVWVSSRVHERVFKLPWFRPPLHSTTLRRMQHGAPCPAGPLPTSPKHRYAAPVRNTRAINLLECRTSIILLLVSSGSSV